MNFAASCSHSFHLDHLGSYSINTNLQHWNQEGESARGRQCRQAMRTRWCGGISADLTFWLPFWSSKKVEENWRFFSPDNFVQIPEFSQSFNRYSYCLNNPLKYKDLTGQWYDDDYGDYGDSWGDDEDGPRRPMSRDQFYDWLDKHFPDKYQDVYEFRDNDYPDRDDSGKDYYNATNHPDPFDNEGQDGHDDPPIPPASHKGGQGAVSLGMWCEGMPTTVILNGQTYVVPYKGNNYVNINDKNLLQQFKDLLHDGGKTYRFHPLGLQLSGKTRGLLDYWAMSRISFTFPEQGRYKSVKEKQEQDNIQQRIYYYRKELIIR